MKIVVLDGYTLNPGDLSWDEMAGYGDLKVYDRTDPDPVIIIQAIGDAEIVFTNKTPLTREVLGKVKNVRYIGVLATGYNIVDIAAAAEHTIIVTNVPSYATSAVGQFTFALILELCHHVGDHNLSVKRGDWANSIDFSYWNYPLIELAGKTIGLIGFGRIGQATAKIALALGMNVLAFDHHTDPLPENQNCKYASLNEVFTQSDIISLHCPLTESTKGIINRNNIALMKDGVMIINTSRGPIVVEEDLRDALNSGKVAAAAVDVVSAEPISGDNPLLKAKNCIITPHIAWAPRESRVRLMNCAVENLRGFLEGNLVNVITR